MSRTEFSAKVKGQAWERCNGRCEKCTAKLFPGKFDYDHIKADGLGGEPTLENCAVLCTSCHHVKTVEQDRPIMQKADNIRKKHLGIKKPRGFGNGKFRKKMDGSVVLR
jgi:5-methylcytosine-specific restriction protein A